MCRIPLEGALSSDLNWKRAIDAAQAASGSILWEFDLGLGAFPLEDELSFQGLRAALSHFAAAIYPDFASKTIGASLYQGPLDLEPLLVWSETQHRNWQEWQKKAPDLPEPIQRRLFCADSFASFFQMLSHSMPDELPLYLCFDAKGFSCSEALLLLSKQRYEHLDLAVKNISLPLWAVDWDLKEPSDSRVGVCFPEDRFCTASTLETFEALLTSAKQLGPCRAIHEPFLTEQWDGLDQIAVAPSMLSARGRRQLMGFCAAGGEVVVEGERLGLSNERSFEEIRGRGI